MARERGEGVQEGKANHDGVRATGWGLGVWGGGERGGAVG